MNRNPFVAMATRLRPLRLMAACAPLVLMPWVVAEEVLPPAAEAAPPACASWLNHSIKALHSNEQINLCEATAGKAVLIVNTASHCGFTPQFDGLEELYKTYADQGLVVIGFPSNDFNQESADEAETAKVCRYNYGVTFLMTTPVHVKGPDAYPVFRHLGEAEGEPSWNFHKYLVDREGKVVEHYSSFTSPGSWRLKRAIRKVL